MNLTIPPLLLYLASWLGICGGIWGLFAKVESVLKEDTKRAVSSWLKNLNPEEVTATWPEQFIQVFDSIFGEKHLSWRCFWRSCLASLCSALVTIATVAAVRPGKLGVMAVFISGNNSASDELLSYLPLVLFGTVFLLLIPDYLSLLESRYVIRWMSGKVPITRIFILLSTDFILTYIIYFASSSIFISILWIILGLFGGITVIELLELPLTIIPSVIQPAWEPLDIFLLKASTPIEVVVYSTFFTSVWVWLYALSGGIVKLTYSLGLGVKRFKSIFNIDEKPLQSIGAVSILIVTLIYLLIPLRGWLF